MAAHWHASCSGSRAMQGKKKLVTFAILAALSSPSELFAQDSSDPSGPRGITVAPLGGNHMQVHWTRSVDDVGVARYRVFRREGAGGAGNWPPPFPWMEVGSVEDGTELDDFTVVPETLYTYAVSAVDDAGNESHGGRYGSADEHYSTSLPAFAEASIQIRCPTSPVSVGAPFIIERDLSFTPSTWGVQTAHMDFHAFSDMDAPYTANAFTGGTGVTRTRTHTAASPGVLHVYSENHIRWPGFPSSNAYPWGSPITETMVTSRICRVIVEGGDPMRIEPSSLPGAVPGGAYSASLLVMGEIGGPFVWGVTHGGRLPPGLSIARTTGVISGVPTAIGSYTFTVVAEASGTQLGAGADAERTYTVTVGAGSPDGGAGDGGAGALDAGNIVPDGGVQDGAERDRDASMRPGDSAAPDAREGSSDAAGILLDSGGRPDQEEGISEDGDTGCGCLAIEPKGRVRGVTDILSLGMLAACGWSALRRRRRSP